MNEQLQQALANILGKTLDGIDTATAFVQAELPDVVQQVLTWYAVKGVFLFVVGLIIISVAIIAPVKLLPWASKQRADGAEWTKYNGSSFITSGYYDGFAPVVITLSLISLMSGMVMINLDWLQIWIAPKIWLIEYAADLAK